MAAITKISWADKSWSPWFGCTQVSMGPRGACEGCYARFMSETRQKRVVFGGPGRGAGTRDARAEAAWKEPLRWQREAASAWKAWTDYSDAPWPYSPFVFPSMCDPFDNHPALIDLRRRFFDLIRATPHLTWLPLTKRPGNIVKLFADTLAPTADKRDAALREAWPRNAAIGCTVVTQDEADRDIPKLLAAKAALKPAFAFVSMEPLLGPVDLTSIKAPRFTPEDEEMDWRFSALEEGEYSQFQDSHGFWEGGDGPWREQIDWVITGGETDQGKHRARPSHPDWFRSLRDQCATAGVPFHHKQNGEFLAADQGGAEHHGPLGDALRTGRAVAFDDQWVWRIGKKAAGRLLDGQTHNARPQAWP